MLTIIIIFALAYFTAKVAEGKGMPFALWFVIACLMPGIALIAVLLWPTK